MSMSTISRSKHYIYWVAIVAIAVMAAPALAQTPVATPNPVTFTYTYTQSNPQPGPLPQTVNIADASGTPLTITGTVLTQPVNSTQPLFQIQQNVNSVIVATPIQLLNASGLLVIGGTFTGNLRVTTAGGSVDVPITLLINQSVGLTATPSNLLFQVAFGGFGTAQNVQISSGTNLSYSVTTATDNGVGWMTVTPIAGTLPATLQVNVSSAGLGNGSYTGRVNVTAAGQTLQVPVTMSVGTGSTTLTLNPTSLPFTFATSTSAMQQQYVTANNFAGATSYNATASTTTGFGWLTFAATGGTSLFSQPFSGGQSSILIQASPSGQSVGTYYGTITVTSFPDGATQSAQVVMTIGSGGGGLLSISPSAVTFSAPTIGVSPAQQFVSINPQVAGTTNYSAQVTNCTGGLNWLTINNTTFLSGLLPASFTVSANTSFLSAGNYSCQITINASGAVTTTQIVPVSLTVGFGGGTGTGTSVAPASLTFSGQVGAASRPGTQYIALGGSGGIYTATVSASSGGSTWLTVPTENLNGSGPAFIPVTVNTTGMAAGSYSGTVSIVYGGVTTTVQVSFTLAAGPAVVASPGGAFTNAYSASSVDLSLAMTDGSTPAFTVASSAAWITTNVTQGTLPSSLRINFNTSTQPNGLNSGSVTVTVAGASNTPLTIPVVMNNFAGTGGGTGTGVLIFSPASLAFSGQVGSTPAAQTIFVSSSVFTSFSASASTFSGGNWLFASTASGTAPGGSVTVSVSAAGLSAGTYSGSINFFAGGQSQTVPVSLTVGGSSVTIAASPASLAFDAQAGGAAPAAQTISVTGSGGSATVSVSATTSSGGNWLTATPASGTTTFTAQVTANPAGLAAGTYNGTVTLAGSGTNSVSVSVTLTVRANPTVSATPASFTLSYRAGDAAPATQQIQVSAQNSTTPLTFSASVTGGNTWLAVSPQTGSTPATLNVNITPGALDPGTYNGTIVVTGADQAGGSTTITVALTVTAPLPTVTRVVNNASYTSGALSPGEIVSIFGTFIGPNDPASGGLDTSTNRYVTTLGGVQVLFNGIPGPVLYVSGSQINAIVPYAVAGRLDTFVQVRFRGVTSNTITLPVTTTVPGVYTLNSSGSGPGAILNANGSVNGPANPSDKNAVIVIYATGEGLSQNANGARPETGQIVTVASIADLPRPLLPVAVLIDGQPATITYAGSAPGYVAGLVQINAVVPPTANSGNVSVVISVGSNQSQAGVTVTIR